MSSQARKIRRSQKMKPGQLEQLIGQAGQQPVGSQKVMLPPSIASVHVPNLWALDVNEEWLKVIITTTTVNAQGQGGFQNFALTADGRLEPCDARKFAISKTKPDSAPRGPCVPDLEPGSDPDPDLGED